MIVPGLWLCGGMTLVVLIEAACLRPWGGWVSACQIGLLTVLGLGLWRRPGEAVAAALWGGLLTEGLTTASWGASVLAFGMIAWGTVRVRRHVYKEQPLAQMALAAGAVGTAWVVGWSFVALGGRTTGPLTGWLRGAVMIGVPTVLVAPLWLRLIRPLLRRVW